MRPPRSNVWRPHVYATGISTLDPATPAASNSRTARPNPLSSPHSPPFPPLHPQLTNPLHEPLAHLLVARALDGREIAGHLTILILLDLEHLRATSLNATHQ